MLYKCFVLTGKYPNIYSVTIFLKLGSHYRSVADQILDWVWTCKICKPQHLIKYDHTGVSVILVMYPLLLYLSPLISLSHQFCVCAFSPSIMQGVKHETLTQCGLLLAHRLRRWANISPVLGYRVVFDATLNAGQTLGQCGLALPDPQPCKHRLWTSAGFLLDQRRRLWARIGPALGQHLVFAGSVDRPHMSFAHYQMWRYWNCCPTDRA